MDRVIISFRVHPEFRDRVRRAAKAQEVTVSHFLRQLVLDHLGPRPGASLFDRFGGDPIETFQDIQDLVRQMLGSIEGKPSISDVAGYYRRAPGRSEHGRPDTVSYPPAR